MVEFQPFGPKLPHDPEGTLEHERDVREEAERAHDVKRASETAHPSSLGYAIVLLGAALFVATCFLPYYGYEFAQGGSVSLYDQVIVAYGGGLQLGPKLFLFGGVATVVVVALVGLTRRERSSGRGFLAGAVSVWSLTWIGSLLQSASLRGGGTIRGLTLEVGFWLQAVSIGVTIIGTILVATRAGQLSRTQKLHHFSGPQPARISSALLVIGLERCARRRRFVEGGEPTLVNRVVRPDDIDDLSAQVMARDIAKQVEEELQ